MWAEAGQLLWRAGSTELQAIVDDDWPKGCNGGRHYCGAGFA
jgi:hypothetical protein